MESTSSMVMTFYLYGKLNRTCTQTTWMEMQNGSFSAHICEKNLQKKNLDILNYDSLCSFQVINPGRWPMPQTTLISCMSMLWSWSKGVMLMSVTRDLRNWRALILQIHHGETDPYRNPYSCLRYILVLYTTILIRGVTGDALRGLYIIEVCLSHVSILTWVWACGRVLLTHPKTVVFSGFLPIEDHKMPMITPMRPHLYVYMSLFVIEV